MSRGSDDPVLLREEQRFRLWRQRILLAIPPLFLTFIAVRQVAFHIPWKQYPMSNAGLAGLGILLWAVYGRLVTVRLLTEVRQNELRVGMKGLWRLHRIPLTNIVSMKETTYDAMRDYGGYGVRSKGRDRAFIASGNRGVILGLADGAKLLIGSPDPGKVIGAITNAKASLVHPS